MGSLRLAHDLTIDEVDQKILGARLVLFFIIVWRICNFQFQKWYAHALKTFCHSKEREGLQNSNLWFKGKFEAKLKCHEGCWIKVEWMLPPTQWVQFFLPNCKLNLTVLSTTNKFAVQLERIISLLDTYYCLWCLRLFQFFYAWHNYHLEYLFPHSFD